MSDAVLKLKPLLDALTADERAEIAEYLRPSPNGHAEPAPGDGEEVLTREEWEAAWLPEIERRIADMDSGKTQGVPADEFMKRMKEKYG